MNAKQLIAGGMAALMLVGSAAGSAEQVSAHTLQQEADFHHKTDAQKQDSDLKTHEMQTEFYQVDDLQAQTGRYSLKKIQLDTSYSLADSIWADSGSDYYFSLLRTEEKKLYLNLKKQADRYLTGTESFQATDVDRNGTNATVYILPLISYEGLSTDQMKRVFYCFMYENPQYYFIRNSVIYSENTNRMTVGLYEIFADGAARAEYTRQFAQQLQIWEEQIQAAADILEKEQLIHKIVRDHVAYNEAMATDDPDDKEMSQSCISAVLFEKKTVCAGYAQLFSLLCGRAGITCVTVTSPSHAWNKVRMGNVWYNVDCTWNDCRDEDLFLNVTDEQLLAADTEAREHTLSEEWTDTAPACTEAFDPQQANGEDAPANVLPPNQISDTLSLSSPETGKLAAAFEAVEGCDGYELQYSQNSAMDTADQMETEDASFEISGLKSGQTYFARVRAYRLDCRGVKIYFDFSKNVKGTLL